MSENIISRPRIFNTREIVFIAMFAAVMAVCSWISVPTVVPFTLQTFGVFCAVSILGGRNGFFAILVYILLGAVGLPVFAGFSGGLSSLVSPASGYIWGFLVMALIYWGAEKFFGDKLYVQIPALVIGLAMLYVFGTVWFMYVTKASFAYGFSVCVVPFIAFDLAKMACAVLISGRVRKYAKV